MRSTRFSDTHLSNAAFVEFSSVQDGTCTLGKAHNYVLLRSFPNVAFLVFSSVRFKMASIRSEKPVCVLPVSQTFSPTLPAFSLVQFSSVQGSTYTLEKGRTRNIRLSEVLPPLPLFSGKWHLYIYIHLYIYTYTLGKSNNHALHPVSWKFFEHFV